MSQIPTRASLAVLLLAVAPGLALAQSPTDRSIQSLQLHLKMYPEDYKSYDALGAAYIQKGRETADASYYELAKQALNKSLDLLSSDPAAASAKTHMAVVMMSEHQFEDALRWAEDALALGSGDRSPWAIVGDALTDMGRYAEAEAAYAKLSSPDGDPGLAYQHDSRMAYLRFIHGDSEAATRLMRQAITTAMALHLPAENLAWSEYQLGEICFKSGDLPCAEQAYQASLGFDAGSYRNLGGLAELRTAQERYPEAIALYQKAIAVVPFPAFAAALYDLETQCGNTAEARKQVDLIDFISKLNPVNQRLFYREVALFYADHGLKLAESLGLAEKELEVRKDIYTWDILAWVLYKNGRVAEAAEAMAKARALGTRDAILDFHAGMIEARLGHRDRASTLLASALAPNPHFHVLYADQARVTLAELRAPGSPANSGTTPASSACGGTAADRGKQGTRQP
jgi:tetratricopeptide (TPR) repeat protein